MYQSFLKTTARHHSDSPIIDRILGFKGLIRNVELSEPLYGISIQTGLLGSTGSDIAERFQHVHQSTNDTRRHSFI